MILILMAIESPEDRDLFTRLYTDHAAFLVNAAYRILDDWAEAEDAVQDVFVKLMDSPVQIRRIPENERKMFLLVCTRNRARDMLRKKSRIMEMELESIPEMPGDPEEESDMVGRLKEAMAGLPDHQREILEMHYYWGLKFDEIGQILGKKPAAVQKMSARLTKALRKHLEGDAK